MRQLSLPVVAWALASRLQPAVAFHTPRSLVRRQAAVRVRPLSAASGVQGQEQLVAQEHRLTVPLLTPFTDFGEIDFGSLESHLQFLEVAGINSIICGDSAGEYLSLTLEERQRLLNFCRQRFSGQIINHVSASALHDVLQLIAYSGGLAGAGGLGGHSTRADAILLQPPQAFAGANEEGIEAFLHEALSSCALPSIILNGPTAVPPRVCEALSQTFPHMLGTFDATGARSVSDAHNDALGFYHDDFDPAAPTALTAQGGAILVAACANVVPDLYTQLQAALRVGNAQEARAARAQLRAWRSAAAAAVSGDSDSGGGSSGGRGGGRGAKVRARGAAALKAGVASRLPGYSAAVRLPLTELSAAEQARVMQWFAGGGLAAARRRGAAGDVAARLSVRVGSATEAWSRVEKGALAALRRQVQSLDQSLGDYLEDAADAPAVEADKPQQAASAALASAALASPDQGAASQLAQHAPAAHSVRHAAPPLPEFEVFDPLFSEDDMPPVSAAEPGATSGVRPAAAALTPAAAHAADAPAGEGHVNGSAQRRIFTASGGGEGAAVQVTGDAEGEGSGSSAPALQGQMAGDGVITAELVPAAVEHLPVQHYSSSSGAMIGDGGGGAEAAEAADSKFAEEGSGSGGAGAHVVDGPGFTMIADAAVQVDSAAQQSDAFYVDTAALGNKQILHFNRHSDSRPVIGGSSATPVLAQGAPAPPTSAAAAAAAAAAAPSAQQVMLDVTAEPAEAQLVPQADTEPETVEQPVNVTAVQVSSTDQLQLATERGDDLRTAEQDASSERGSAAKPAAWWLPLGAFRSTATKTALPAPELNAAPRAAATPAADADADARAATADASAGDDSAASPTADSSAAAALVPEPPTLEAPVPEAPARVVGDPPTLSPVAAVDSKAGVSGSAAGLPAATPAAPVASPDAAGARWEYNGASYGGVRGDADLAAEEDFDDPWAITGEDAAAEVRFISSAARADGGGAAAAAQQRSVGAQAQPLGGGGGSAASAVGAGAAAGPAAGVGAAGELPQRDGGDVDGEDAQLLQDLAAAVAASAGESQGGGSGAGAGEPVGSGVTLGDAQRQWAQQVGSAGEDAQRQQWRAAQAAATERRQAQLEAQRQRLQAQLQEQRRQLELAREQQQLQLARQSAGGAAAAHGSAKVGAAGAGAAAQQGVRSTEPYPPFEPNAGPTYGGQKYRSPLPKPRYGRLSPDSDDATHSTRTDATPSRVPVRASLSSPLQPRSAAQQAHAEGRARPQAPPQWPARNPASVPMGGYSQAPMGPPMSPGSAAQRPLGGMAPGGIRGGVQGGTGPMGLGIPGPSRGSSIGASYPLGGSAGGLVDAAKRTVNAYAQKEQEQFFSSKGIEADADSFDWGSLRKGTNIFEDHQKQMAQSTRRHYKPPQ